MCCASIIVIDAGKTEADESDKSVPWKDGDHVLRTIYEIIQLHGPDGVLDLVTTVHPDGTA